MFSFQSRLQYQESLKNFNQDCKWNIVEYLHSSSSEAWPELQSWDWEHCPLECDCPRTCSARGRCHTRRTSSPRPRTWPALSCWSGWRRQCGCRAWWGRYHSHQPCCSWCWRVSLHPCHCSLPVKPNNYNTSLWLVSWVGSDLWLVDSLPSSVLWECWPGSGLTVSSPASTQCWSEHISANTKSQMQTFSLHHPKIYQ